MATLTAVAASSPDQPKVLVAGTVTRVQTYTTTASLSVGDVIWFNSIPIPHGAEIISAKLGAATDTTSTTSVSIVFALGLNYNGAVDYRRIWGSATFSQSAWKTVNYQDAWVLSAVAALPWPTTLSLSDDFQPRYVVPIVNVDSFSYGSLTGSTTVRMALAITYTMDR